MAKNLTEITGFNQLQLQLKRLPDKVKKRELVKILGQVANPTLKVMRQKTPVSTGMNKGYARKKRQIGKTVIASTYTPGYGKKTIAKATMRRTGNAVVMVGPRSRKGKDGYYLRQWVIPGTKYFEGNNFVAASYKQTKGLVTADAEVRVAKYVQKQINRLSK